MHYHVAFHKQYDLSMMHHAYYLVVCQKRDTEKDYSTEDYRNGAKLRSQEVTYHESTHRQDDAYKDVHSVQKRFGRSQLLYSFLSTANRHQDHQRGQLAPKNVLFPRMSIFYALRDIVLSRRFLSHASACRVVATPGSSNECKGLGWRVLDDPSWRSLSEQWRRVSGFFRGISTAELAGLAKPTR